MTNKKRKVKLAKLLRKVYGIEFIESQNLAKDILRFGIHQAMDKNAYKMKSKIPCRCGHCISGEVVYVDESRGIRFDPNQIVMLMKEIEKKHIKGEEKDEK